MWIYVFNMLIWCHLHSFIIFLPPGILTYSTSYNININLSITNLSFNFIETLCMSSKFPINIFLVYIMFMKYIYGLMVLFLFARTMQSDSLFEWGSVCGWKHPEMCLSGRFPGVALSVWWVKTVKLSICITIYSHLPTPERIKSLWYCNLYQTIFNKFLW